MIEYRITIDEDLDDIVAILPESWDEISVDDYQRLFNKDFATLPAIQQTLHIITSLTKLPEDVVLLLPIDEFKSMVEKIRFVYGEIEKVDVEYIEINDEKYYLYTDYSSLTTGEIISLDTLLESNSGNINRCLSDILCLFLRKKKDNGKLEKFSTTLFERKEMFSKLPINQVYHLIIFFLDTKNISKVNTRDYTEENPN